MKYSVRKRPAEHTLTIIVIAWLFISMPFAAAGSESWTGVPAPSFGLSETAPPVPGNWTTQYENFYFVKPDDPAATDDGNQFGSAVQPRKTIPRPLPSGAVVELHGTFTNDITIVAEGTATAPVFVRGASYIERPVFKRRLDIVGSSYLVVENILIEPLNADLGNGEVGLSINEGSTHVSVRHSEFTGAGNLNRNGNVGVGSWSYEGTEEADHIVLYDLDIHDTGDVNATFDQDAHSIVVNGSVRYLWILGSRLTRSSGDGVQIEAQHTRGGDKIQFVYVAGNTISSNKQTGLWIKHARNVVFSENEIFDMTMGCAGYQYTGDNFWFVNNILHDCYQGIIGQSSDEDVSSQAGVYYVGNRIFDIASSDPTNPHQAGGIVIRLNGSHHHVVNNTIVGADRAISAPIQSGDLTIVNNVIVNSDSADGDTIYVESASSSTTIDYNLFYGATPTAFFLNGETSLSEFQATGGCAHCIEDLALFTDLAARDLSLTANSPAIDRGVASLVYDTFQRAFGTSIEIDSAGQQRPFNEWDMGALEWGDGSGSVDSDGDGVPDTQDAFPLDPNETVDTDGDGIGNNADDDDDNDEVPDAMDAFPLDPQESIDTDGDGVGNNADSDDDNDLMPDLFETTYGLDPLDPADADIDTDGDGTTNVEEYLAGTDPTVPGSDPAVPAGDGSEVLIDFYTANPPPGNWNAFAAGIGFSSVPLIDTAGYQSAYTFSTAPWLAAGTSHSGDLASDFPWPVEAALESWTHDGQVVMTIGGLPAGASVHVELLSRNTYNIGAITDIDINGVVRQDVIATDHVDGTRIVWAGVAVGPDGNLVLTFTPDAATSNYVEVSAMTFSVLGDAVDTDGDGYPDSQDAFPLDRTEWVDSDADGIGNNADIDDDNDGMPDTFEQQYGFDRLDPADAAQDYDNDGASNLSEYMNGTDPTVPDMGGVDSGTRVLIDFYSTIAPNGNWNAFAAGLAYQSIALIDDNGDPTTVSFTTEPWKAAGQSHSGGLSKSFPWPIETALQGWEHDGGTEMVLSGFAPGDRVRVEVLTRNTYNIGAETDLGINGDVKYDLRGSDYRDGERVIWDEVQVDGDGNLRFVFTPSGKRSAYVEISAISVTVLAVQ